MINLKSYVKGNVIIRLTGPTPERFFNICYANKIELHDIKYIDDVYYFSINPKEYFNLKPIIKKTGSKTMIIKKYGVGFYIFRYRKHNCFAAGIMMAAFLIYLMTLFLWDIQMDGNYMITNDMIMEVLHQNNIHHGMLMKKIKCEEIEKQLRKEFDDITWVSVEATGTKIAIYIKENDEDYVVSKSKQECDIVAACDGTVEYIITRAGTPLKKIGDEIKKGDIIVSGVVNVYDDYKTIIDKKYVASDADLLIRTEYTYNDSIDVKYKYKLYTGKVQKNYYINILNYYISPSFRKKFENTDIITNDHQVKLGNNLYLPIHYGTKENIEYIEQTANYTATQADIILQEHLNFFLSELTEKGVQIIEKDVKIGKDSNKYTYTGKIVMIAPAYEKVSLTQNDTELGDINEHN